MGGGRGGCYGVRQNIWLSRRVALGCGGRWACGDVKPVGVRNCGIAIARKIYNLECVRGLSSVVWGHVGDYAIS